jgi:hypothetical protein
MMVIAMQLSLTGIRIFIDLGTVSNSRNGRSSKIDDRHCGDRAAVRFFPARNAVRLRSFDPFARE